MVILFVPRDKTFYPGLNRCPGFEPNILYQIINVCIGFRNITRLKVNKFFFCRFTQLLFYYVYEIEEFYGIIVPNIIDLVRLVRCSGIRSVA